MVLTWSATFEAGSRPVPSAQKCWNVRRCLSAYPDAPDRKYLPSHLVRKWPHSIGTYIMWPLFTFHGSYGGSICLGDPGDRLKNIVMFSLSWEMWLTNMLFLLEIFTQNDSIERECTCKMMWIFFQDIQCFLLTSTSMCGTVQCPWCSVMVKNYCLVRWPSKGRRDIVSTFRACERWQQRRC